MRRKNISCHRFRTSCMQPKVPAITFSIQKSNPSHITPANSQCHCICRIIGKIDWLLCGFGFVGTFVGIWKTFQLKLVKCCTKHREHIIHFHITHAKCSDFLGPASYHGTYARYNTIFVCRWIIAARHILVSGIPRYACILFAWCDDKACNRASSPIFNISCAWFNWDWPYESCCLQILRLLSSRTDFFSLYPKQ